ncbi:DNA-directed primase/polymerase protein [Rhinophrynus dorsalis]
MKRRWMEKVKTVEELASHYGRHPLTLVYKPKLAKPWQPPSVWKLFPRQAVAFDFVKSCKEDVHVFAVETVIDNTERRLYLVTTYTEFWFYYTKRPETLAHCYEVIPADTVCKLYFDLEFYKPANPGVDGRKMVAVVIKYFIKKLEEIYGIGCSEDYVLNLDSSTEEKFSRHLIFVLPNAAFKDNIHAGNFIKRALQPVLSFADYKSNTGDSLCATHIFSTINETVNVCDSQMEQSCQSASRENTCNGNIEKENDLSSLIVKDKHGRNRLFIDLGVYTKNRNFRLYKSSKLGKNVIFELADDNKFAIKPPQKYICVEEYIFLCSLISNIRYSDSLRILSCTSTENEDCKNMCLRSIHCNSSVIAMKGYQFSPYPEIDYFIISVITRDGFQGGIRHWNYFSTEELLVYDITNYRWCENIGRFHKSNNIMLLVDLKGDVWYQKCHDPVCRAQNFKSKCYPLPPEVCLPFIFKEEDDKCFFTMDESGNIKETKLNHGQVSEQASVSMSEELLTTCYKDWDSGIDDASILEATEDIELADAMDYSLTDCDFEDKEIPDKLLLESLNELNTTEMK